MRVIGFASRLKVVETLESLGCAIQPQNWRELSWPYSHKPEATGTIPFQPITSDADLGNATDVLSSDIERIFGMYASWDLVRGGALSNVIIHELGANIIDHAQTHNGFLASRVVSGITRKHFGAPRIGREIPRFFQPKGQAEGDFLEVAIWDDGIGIPQSLRETLRKSLERRPELRGRFDPNRDEDVVAFAFDRLSSSKRSALELLGDVYCDRQSPHSIYRSWASGLFWVWNLLRTYQGFLLVRSGDCELAYDFSDVNEIGEPRQFVAEAPMVGTQLWICSPGNRERHETGPRRGRAVSKKAAEVPPSFHFHWVGDLSRTLRISELDQTPDKDLAQDLYEKLMKIFEGSAKKNSVFVLDLTSLHQDWFHRNATHVVSAILEMNYASTLGLYTAVLFNAPADKRGVLLPVFQDHCRLLRERQPDLAKFRLATVVFWDDRKTVDFVSPRDEVCGVLSCFGDSPNDLSVAEVYAAAREERGARGVPLNEDEVLRILRENAHVVREIEATGSERRFRLTLRSDTIIEAAKSCYSEELKTIAEAEILDTKSLEKGSLAFVRRDPNGFWLPSSGLISEEFWQVGVLASSMMWRSRIGWLLTNEIAELVERGEGVDFTATITRSTPLFIQEASRFIRVCGLPASTIVADDLATLLARLNNARTQMGGLDGTRTVVFFTDIISTGRLVERACEELDGAGFDVRRIFCVADIRSENEFKRIPKLNEKIVSIIRKHVNKLEPVRGHPVHIDDLEVCPIGKVPKTLWKTKGSAGEAEPMWILEPNSLIDLAAEGDGLSTGHIRMGDYHHYVYYMKGPKVISRTIPGAGVTAVSKLIEIMKGDLGGVAPEQLVVLYMDHASQEWRGWVNEVCRQTGALWRHILYRDLAGGRWQFSAFVEHGVPLTGKIVILLDDGSCTGDTLAALIETAAVGGASKVLAYIFVDRMPLVKSDLFAKIQMIQTGPESAAEVKVRALGGLQIPVYTPDSCPLCLQLKEAEQVTSRFATLRRTAQAFCRGLDTEEQAGKATQGSGNPNEDPFPWSAPADRSLLWKIRQALEYFPYEEPVSQGDSPDSLEFLDSILRSRDGALALAFVVSTEVRMAAHRWFRKHVDELINSWIGYGHSSGDWIEMATYLGAVYRLSEASFLPNNVSRTDLVWRLAGCFPNDLSGRLASERLLLLIASGLLADEGTPRKTGAVEWLAALQSYARQQWSNYPLRLTACRLKPTRFLGRLSAVPSPVTASSMEQLNQHLGHLVVFIGLHSIDDEVDRQLADALASLRNERPTEGAVAAIAFLEGFEEKLEAVLRCSEILSQVTPTATALDHPLILRGSITRELQGVLELYEAVIDATEWLCSQSETAKAGPMKERSAHLLGAIELIERLKKLWADCKLVIKDFLGCILVDVSEKANTVLTEFIQGKDDIDGSFRAPDPKESQSVGVIPACFLRAFLKICLDNAYEAYKKEDVGKTIEVGLETESNFLLLSVFDKGKPFRPDSDISGHSLGRIRSDLQQVGVEVELPPEGISPKRFVIRIPKARLSPRHRRETDRVEGQ
jgi:hypothetical protein